MMTRVFKITLSCLLDLPLDLKGSEDAMTLATILSARRELSHSTNIKPGDRYMISISFPAAENKAAQEEACKRVEKLLQETGIPGWTWRLSDRKDSMDDHVIGSQDNDFHNHLHDIGAKGRREFYTLMKGRWSAYYTATKV